LKNKYNDALLNSKNKNRKEMRLIDCSTLISIEGEVYKLSAKDYNWFKDQVYKSHCSDNILDWSELLHWVQDNGKFVCVVETYNF
jgi:hypothetical protein